MYNYTCPICGANLDPGEKCDCVRGEKMQRPTAKAQNIPKRQRDQLAAPLLKLVREAFEDPQTVAEFTEWRRRRNQQNEKKENSKW